MGLPMYQVPMTTSPALLHAGSRNQNGPWMWNQFSAWFSMPLGCRIQAQRKTEATPVTTVGM